MNNFYTYELCSSETPWLPFYIGKGCGNRMHVHEYNALKDKCRNKHLQKRILRILNEGNKIYYHKFNDNVSEEDALKCEEIAIATFRSAGIHLCNMTNGGGNCILNEEARQKISKANKGKISKLRGRTLSDETKKKISLAKCGHLVSLETRQKISKAKSGCIGIPCSNETKLLLSKLHKGKTVSSETRRKISLSNIGKASPFKNKRHTLQSKEKISKSKLNIKPSKLTRLKMSETHKLIWRKRKCQFL
jgi:hypothetical protein